MDIKKTIEDVVKKITSDKDLQEKFMKNPAGAIKDLTGLDLPKDQVDSVVNTVKSKISLDKAGDMLSGLFKK